MKAKDTVMTTEDVLVKLRELPDDKWLEILGDMHTYERTLQAEISFEAGIKEAKRRIGLLLGQLKLADRNYLELKNAFDERIEKAKRLGIKEVVEWIKASGDASLYTQCGEYTDEWQAKLKEWGVE